MNRRNKSRRYQNPKNRSKPNNSPPVFADSPSSIPVVDNVLKVDSHGSGGGAIVSGIFFPHKRDNRQTTASPSQNDKDGRSIVRTMVFNHRTIWPTQQSSSTAP